MSNTNQRTKAGLNAGKNKTAGRMVVTYRDVNGKTMNALVLGQGTASGLKLQIRNSNTDRIVDNVALASTDAQTGVYHSRSTV